MTNIMAGAIGINLRIETGVDLTGYSSALIKVLNPDQTTSTWTPDSIDAENGYLYYETTDGDFDDDGEYLFQSYVVFTDGEERIGYPARLNIYKNRVSLS